MLFCIPLGRPLRENILDNGPVVLLLRAKHFEAWSVKLRHVHSAAKRTKSASLAIQTLPYFRSLFLPAVRSRDEGCMLGRAGQWTVIKEQCLVASVPKGTKRVFHESVSLESRPRWNQCHCLPFGIIAKASSTCFCQFSFKHERSSTSMCPFLKI